jgi:hypothetical protein
MANGTTEGGTPRLVLAPDGVHGLARNRDPAARFAGDLDHASRVRLGSVIASWSRLRPFFNQEPERLGHHSVVLHRLDHLRRRGLNGTPHQIYIWHVHHDPDLGSIIRPPPHRLFQTTPRPKLRARSGAPCGRGSGYRRLSDELASALGVIRMSTSRERLPDRGCPAIPIGAAGFEPATFGPPDQRANQAAPRPAARQTVAHPGRASQAGGR